MASSSPQRLPWAAGKAVTACACFSKEKCRTSKFWSTDPLHENYLRRVVIITIPQPDPRFLNQKSGESAIYHTPQLLPMHLGLRPPDSSLHSLILRFFSVPWTRGENFIPSKTGHSLARQSLHTAAWRWDWTKRPSKPPPLVTHIHEFFPMNTGKSSANRVALAQCHSQVSRFGSLVHMHS